MAAVCEYELLKGKSRKARGMSFRLVVVLFSCLLARSANAQLQLWSHPDEPGQWLPWGVSCDMVLGPLHGEWEKQLKEIAAGAPSSYHEFV